MKKILLSIVTVFTLASVVSAQTLTINVDGETADISGTAVEATPLTTAVINHHLIDFIVNNNTGADQQFRLTRKIVNETPGWTNYFCWGLNPGIGTCYQVVSDIVWTAPVNATFPIIIPNGGSGKIASYCSAPTGGSATYRYLISLDGINYIDSVDVEVNSSLSIEEENALTLSIAPNPSSEYFVVNTTNADGGTIRVVDVLGNIILDENLFSASKKISVSNFRNGVYFVTVNANNSKPTTRKIIVQH